MLPLLDLAAHKTGDRESGKELVQETFVSLHARREQLSAGTPLRAYLYVTLKHKLLNHYRQALVHQRYEDYFAGSSSEADHSTELLIESRELERLIETEIERLPPQCQAVFRLSRQENLSNKEIAARLGISENTVEGHMRKALRMLRTGLGKVMELLALIYLIHH